MRYFNLLVNECKINRLLLIESKITEDSCESIYALLKTSTETLGYAPLLCDVKEAWQLQALSGETRFYGDLIHKIDSWREAGLGLYAAMSGKVEAIEWVRNNHPVLLRQKDKRNCSIGHYGVWSRSIEMCQWLYDEAPMVFSIRNIEGGLMLDEALRREDPQLLNIVLKLSNNPLQLEIQSSLGYLVVTSVVLSRLLESNYTLISVMCGDDELHFSRTVQEKLQRNRALNDTIAELYTPHYQDTSLQTRYQRWALVNQDALQMLSEDTKKSIFQTFFHGHNDGLFQSIDAEIARLMGNSSFTTSWNVSLMTGMARASDDKIRALHMLKSLIMYAGLDETKDFSELFQYWKNHYQTLIDQQENVVSSVYSAVWQQTPTPTRVFVDGLNVKMNQLFPAAQVNQQLEESMRMV